MYADLAAEQAAKSREPADAEYALQRAERKTTLNVRRRRHVAPPRPVRLPHRPAESTKPSPPPSAHAASTTAQPTTPPPSTPPTRSPKSSAATPQRPNTQLLILADYDHTADTLGNPRLDDGTPLSAELLAQEALNADIYCGVFNADWTNLALGRTRNANDAQRLILAARDGGCVHCNAHTEHTHAHHTTPHAAGGPTEITNLELLCAPATPTTTKPKTTGHRAAGQPRRSRPPPASRHARRSAARRQRHRRQRSNHPRPLNPPTRRAPGTAHTSSGPRRPAGAASRCAHAAARRASRRRRGPPRRPGPTDTHRYARVVLHRGPRLRFGVWQPRLWRPPPHRSRGRSARSDPMSRISLRRVGWGPRRRGRSGARWGGGRRRPHRPRGPPGTFRASGRAGSSTRRSCPRNSLWCSQWK